MSGRQRIVVAIVFVGLISAVGLVIAGRRSSAAATGTSTDSTSSASTKTATAKRMDLVDRTTVDGELGYGDTTSIAAPGDGMVTALPAAGTVVERGQSIARIDEHPLPLLYGTLPLYRDLSAASSDGADIHQLEDNLVALGYGDGVTVDDHFDSATQAAVQRWQKALGVEQNGMVARGSFVIAPGPVRIQEQKVHVGDRANPGNALVTVTGTARLVTIDLDPAKQSFVKVGDPAEVELPDHRRASGHIATVGTVATASSDGSDKGGDGSTTSTIAVTVTLDDPATAGTLDQAPVSVRIVRSTATNVLAVPVKALLVLKEGGYAVQRTDTNGVNPTLVPVKTGSYADGMVEITGSINDGDPVVVAS